MILIWQRAREALASLVKEEEFPPVRPFVNAHAHTFYSFNYKGYSPSRFVLEARREGLEMGGIVDFDVLDGLEEFWEASRLLDLKGCVGIESRVFVPEFSQIAKLIHRVNRESVIIWGPGLPPPRFLKKHRSFLII